MRCRRPASTASIGWSRGCPRFINPSSSPPEVERSAPMQKTLICGAILLCIPLQGQKWEPGAKAELMPVSTETRSAVQKIIGDTLVNGQASEYDRQLADEIGPRLTGSANYLKAV